MTKIRGYKDILTAYCELFKNQPEVDKVDNIKPFTEHHIVLHFSNGTIGDFHYKNEKDWSLLIQPDAKES